MIEGVATSKITASARINAPEIRINIACLSIWPDAILAAPLFQAASLLTQSCPDGPIPRLIGRRRTMHIGQDWKSKKQHET
jgi:hypothetical protein